MTFPRGPQEPRSRPGRGSGKDCGSQRGRRRVNQWIRADNTPTTTVEIDAYSVGHDLSFGATTFRKVSRAQVDSSDRMADEHVQAVHAGFEVGDADTDEYIVGEEDEGVELGSLGSREGADALTPA